jgi:GNAT superfamily N-acetyltransferase
MLLLRGAGRWHDLSVSQNLSVEIIHPDDWVRLRAIRLNSLLVNPEAFGGDFETESAEDESTWREKFEKLDFVIASINGVDAALMSVEELDGDFGATCWIGGCWSDPQFRGEGLFRAMFNFLDAENRNWKIQGLGVWTDNFDAIAAYEKLGFVKMGEDMASTRQPGKFYQRMIRKSKI